MIVFRTGFDMDPFVITAFSKNIFRTKWLRHNLNPVYNEKFLFEVGAFESNYDLVFKVVDHDKMSLNDSIAVGSFNVQSIINSSAQVDPETGLYSFNIETSSPSQDTSSKAEDSPTVQKIADDFSSAVGKDLRTDIIEQIIPLTLCCKHDFSTPRDVKLSFKAMFFPIAALRQKFWRVMLAQYGDIEDGHIGKLGMYAVLDTLGSNIPNSMVDDIYTELSSKNHDDTSDSITVDEAVICLERLVDLVCHQDQQATQTPQSPSSNEESGPGTPTQTSDQYEDSEDSRNFPSKLYLVYLSNCPLCLKFKLSKVNQQKATVHLATCASHDWKRVDRLMMTSYVSLNQAQRRWFSKAFAKVVYGSSKVGSTSATTLVQNRQTGQIQEEKMNAYVRIGIRLLYRGIRNRRIEGSKVKKILRSLTLKQGMKYDSPISVKEIKPFIRFFDLNMNEVDMPVGGFKTFNEFFYRKLKPGSRPCAFPDNPDILVSPADSRIVAYECIEKATTYWIKGTEFTVERLLGYSNEAQRFVGGSICISRLAPQDYHRFHSPVNGCIGPITKIEGQYYTVNPMAIRSYLDVFGENVRVLIPIDSNEFGKVMLVAVGAMMVGSTVLTVDEGKIVQRSDELGYFKFGGSTVITLFEPNVTSFDEDLLRNSKTKIETLVKMGERIGQKIDPNKPTDAEDHSKSDS